MDSATEYCRKALLEDSTAIKNCLAHLSNFDPEFGLESCVEDLMVGPELKSTYMKLCIYAM